MWGGAQEVLCCSVLLRREVWKNATGDFLESLRIHLCEAAQGSSVESVLVFGVGPVLTHHGDAMLLAGHPDWSEARF